VASARRRIKRLALHSAAALGVWAGVALEARAQAPDDDWRTLTTEHFRVTFPSRLEALGRRAASTAEAAYARLATDFVEPPGDAIDLLVTDHADESNGYATILPSNRIVVYARPPVDGPSLMFFDDWMELVVTHELVHIVHLDHVRNPIGRLLRGVFGRADGGWPYFPNLDAPVWTIEGLATWYESDLTRAGRTHGSFTEMVLRTAVLEGRFEGIDQASGASPLWPGGNRYYTYGPAFFDYLLERHGEERMAAFADAVGGQWIPYRLNAAGRSAFGVSLSQSWREWSDSLRAHYRGLDAELSRLGPVTEPERLTVGARWAFHPSVSPDGGTLVYVRADGRSDVQLERQPLAGGDAEQLTRTNGLATYTWLPGGALLLSQLEQDGPFRAYADLYVVAPDGAVRRVTRGARLEQPSAAPDGTWALAVQNGDGTNGLARVDLVTGAVSTLVAPDPDVHWAFPRIAPNGRWIAATRWQPGAYLDVVILDAANGRELQRVTRDRAVDLAPAWSPDSRWLVWSSDRTGIPNVLGAQVDPATGRVDAPRLFTNVRTGASYPSIDPAGEWLYFSGYHVDGWEVERVRFEPDASRPAPPVDARFAEAAPWTPPAAQAGPVGSYSAWPTLLPSYWLPRLREPVVAPATQVGSGMLSSRELLDYGIGVETSGVDLVGRHAYAMYASVFTSDAKVEGGIGYAYGGFGNPVLRFTAEQTWSSGGQLLAGGTDRLFVLERERVVDASVTLLRPRARRSLSLTLGGGMVWESSQLLDYALETPGFYTLEDPEARLGELRVSLGMSTARSFSFQTGGASGVSAAVQARSRRHFGLDATEVGVIGEDRTFAELTGRVRAYVPLWGGGHARHVLALQAAGGAAFGPGAQRGHFGVGGASGIVEGLTGLELFGGSFLFLPVRGYPTSSRSGAYAWAGSAEYRFPLALVNRGLGAWPLWFDRVVGSLFADAGNAWEPNPLGSVAASVGAEISVSLVGFWTSGLLVRTGVAQPLVGGANPQVYVRSGLSF